MAYEMYMTFYEKKAVIDAIAVCGNTVVGYTSDSSADTEYMAAEAQKLIRKNGYKVDVKNPEGTQTFSRAPGFHECPQGFP